MAEQATIEFQHRAQTALATSPIYDLRRLTVEPGDGRLIITGRVASFYHKQMAQELVQAVAEGLEVDNQTDVPEYVSPAPGLR